MIKGIKYYHNAKIQKVFHTPHILPTLFLFYFLLLYRKISDIADYQYFSIKNISFDNKAKY